MNIYLDTSGLVKLLVQEDGSETMVRVWDEADFIFAGVLAYPEARAALATGERGRRLSEAEHHRAKRILARRWDEIQVVQLDGPLAVQAGDLSERYGLRAYDAVHLACALALAGTGAVLATWDRELHQAARWAGLSVIPAAI